jgi:putative molybdopterin biosynthesis protein
MTEPARQPDTRPDAARQDQFLTILPRDEAMARFAAALAGRTPARETVALAAALGRVVAVDLSAPIDVPPFDRSGVDGFAVRAADLAGATAASPKRLSLNPETIACGVAPRLAIRPGTATPIATGGPIPRGADAVVMIEHTEPDGDGILVSKPANPGQFIGFAGSDMARGEALLRAGSLITAREIAMLAACGIAHVPVVKRPRVAVLSTGDELVTPGNPLPAAGIYDSNGPIILAALVEHGAEPVDCGVVRDDPAALEAAIRQAHATCDMVILSGGTSKGAGDATWRILNRLGVPGIVAHGVALKPGKPLCLAVCDGKPVVALPGFPTSAMFTFHDMVAPFIRRMAGLPARTDSTVTATLPVRVASDIGRTEFVMVALAQGADGLVAFPAGKGSGAVTAFAQADGFFAIDALADHAPANIPVDVTLFAPQVRVPSLTIAGSHCTGLEPVLSALAAEGIAARSLAVGSLGGLAALRRGECDLAPIHLLDPTSGSYNRPFLDATLDLVAGWRRLQVLAFRPGDRHFAGKALEPALAAALADPDALFVNRNQGAGTRVLADRLLAGRKPPGYWNQPKSHNAVGAAIAQGRADWGLTIAPVAAAYGLAAIPVLEEHYDFAVAHARRDKPAVQRFLATLTREDVRTAIRAAGFTPAEPDA